MKKHGESGVSQASVAKGQKLPDVRIRYARQICWKSTEIQSKPHGFCGNPHHTASKFT